MSMDHDDRLAVRQRVELAILDPHVDVYMEFREVGNNMVRAAEAQAAPALEEARVKRDLGKLNIATRTLVAVGVLGLATYLTDPMMLVALAVALAAALSNTDAVMQGIGKLLDAWAARIKPKP